METRMTNSLKTCPFCGGEAEFTKTKSSYDGTIFYGIECANTGCCEIPPIYTEAAAIQKWNTRKPMDRIVEQLEEVKRDSNTDVYAYGAYKKAITIVKGVQNE